MKRHNKLTLNCVCEKCVEKRVKRPESNLSPRIDDSDSDRATTSSAAATSAQTAGPSVNVVSSSDDEAIPSNAPTYYGSEKNNILV